MNMLYQYLSVAYKVGSLNVDRTNVGVVLSCVLGGPTGRAGSIPSVFTDRRRK